MPTNVRVERQAFGRAASASKKGSGTYIVYDPRLLFTSDLDVASLLDARDECETERLNVTRHEQFVRIVFEDKLFVRFNDMRVKHEQLSDQIYPAAKQNAISEHFSSQTVPLNTKIVNLQILTA
jgi:hypothetical protein